MQAGTSLEAIYSRRTSRHWLHRLRRLIEPPAPFIMNPAEPKDFPLGRWNLCIGGAGRVMDGYVNLDLFAMPGVNVAPSFPSRLEFFNGWNATRFWNTFAIPPR